MDVLGVDVGLLVHHSLSGDVYVRGYICIFSASRPGVGRFCLGLLDR